MKLQIIAAIAHAINLAYCQSLGDNSQPEWADAPDWQKQSALYGVEMHLANPDATPEQSHKSWLKQKLADGWKYGKVKDADKKEHPCCVPYDELPPEQKAKDYLFRGVVHALKDIPDPDDLKIKWQQEAVTQYQQQLAGVTSIKGAASGQDPKMAAPTAVKYIGRRDEWRDSVYGTGLYFVQNQTRMLPAEIARKLLKHSDLFEVGDVAEDVASDQDVSLVDDTSSLLKESQDKAEEEDSALNEVQDTLDQINRMDKAGLVNYARDQYQQNLDKKSNLTTLREQVTQLVNQFGVV